MKPLEKAEDQEDVPANGMIIIFQKLKTGIYVSAKSFFFGKMLLVIIHFELEYETEFILMQLS